MCLAGARERGREMSADGDDKRRCLRLTLRSLWYRNVLQIHNTSRGLCSRTEWRARRADERESALVEGLSS